MRSLDADKNNGPSRGRTLNDLLRKGRCRVLDQFYAGKEVPFGVQNEENRLIKPVVIGLVAIVAVLIGVSVISLLGGSAIPAFSLDNSVAADSNAGTFTITSSSENDDDQLAYVYVVGCVSSPGVYGVSKGARLIEVIQAAGGFTEDAAQTELNLAREVVDGEQVHVFSVADVEASSVSTTSSSNATSESASRSSANGSATSSSSGIDASGKVNINTATSEELQTVSGIGPSIASKIIAERQANGSFSSVDDLTRVSGIGEKKLAAFRDYLTV